MKKCSLTLIALVVLVSAALIIPPVRRAAHPLIVRVVGQATLVERVEQYGPTALGRLLPRFAAAGIEYPPRSVLLLGLKKERRLEVFAADEAGEMGWIGSYQILGASGGLGPKLTEGDRQVPEGVYRVESLNPDSRFHLSMRLNYPNDFDLRMAGADGRDNPGSDIFIHGGKASVGCLAMGDEAIEELFVLVADVGCENVEVILAPYDLCETGLPEPDHRQPNWQPELYADLLDRMQRLGK